jgi:hypothetical protein
MCASWADVHNEYASRGLCISSGWQWITEFLQAREETWEGMNLAMFYETTQMHEVWM